MALFNSIAAAIERFSEWTGRAVAWLVLAMVLLICYDVAMRYFFQAGSVALQELEWHLFSLIFLLGAGYTLKHDGHVRVDVLFQWQRVTARHRAWIDVFGVLFLLWPFCALIIWSSFPFVYNAYVFGEGSPDPGGLPYRFLLKAAIPLGFLLVAVQGLGHLIRNLQVLSEPGGPQPRREE